MVIHNNRDHATPRYSGPIDQIFLISGLFSSVVERRTRNTEVIGSIPIGGTFFLGCVLVSAESAIFPPGAVHGCRQIYKSQ